MSESSMIEDHDPLQPKREIIVNAKLASAVYEFVAKKDVRYFLQGMLIEPHEECGVYLVATDGHCMLVGYDPEGYSNGRHIVSLSKRALDACKEKRGKDKPRPVHTLQFIENFVLGVPELVNDEEHPNFDELCLDDELVKFLEPSKAIDGKFPEWKRLVDQTICTEPPPKIDSKHGYNIEYITKFGKAAAKLGRWQFVNFVHHNQVSTVIRFSGDESLRHLFGLVMPAKVEFDETQKPSWMNLK